MTAVIGSLCSGYGGLEQGLALALGGDVRTAWHVEFDKHPSAILSHRYPGVPNHGDVKTTDWTQVEPIDWLTAGYPCQPFSHAGKRGGANDPRHLWPDVARCIGVLRPRGVLLENVRGHLSLGLADVLADLSGLGYDARWGVVRAADAGAPHGRARIFIVATDTRRSVRWSAPGDGRTPGQHLAATGRVKGAVAPTGDRDTPPDTRGGPLAGAAAAGDGLRLAAERGAGVDADTSSDGHEGRPSLSDDGAPRGDGSGDAFGVLHHDVQWGTYAPAIARWASVLGRPAPRPTEPGRNGERLSPRFVEWLMGLPDGWVTDVPGLPRNAQLKALGNGVVPQQAALACRLLGVTAEAVAA